jgi:redox-sensitive bicupin YhaK (pirin superfamily)
MIQIYPAAERGNTRRDWLDSYHTFSFNQYYDPRKMGFRSLRVVNDDFVTPGGGFGTHSHQDMEIISYVLKGGLAHKDSTGGEGVIRPGEVQRMTAGAGISHSEFNISDKEEVHFLQIWILPERGGLAPGYEQKAFPDAGKQNQFRLLVSPDGADGSLRIHQDVKTYDAHLNAGASIRHELPAGRNAWAQVALGEATLNGQPLKAGDGAAISGESQLTFTSAAGADLLLFDLA